MHSKSWQTLVLTAGSIACFVKTNQFVVHQPYTKMKTKEIAVHQPYSKMKTNQLAVHQPYTKSFSEEFEAVISLSKS